MQKFRICINFVINQAFIQIFLQVRGAHDSLVVLRRLVPAAVQREDAGELAQQCAPRAPRTALQYALIPTRVRQSLRPFAVARAHKESGHTR